MLKILEGSIVAGKSGQPLKVVAIEGEFLILCTGKGEVRAKRSAILQVLTPPPAEPAAIEIGDLLCRKAQPKQVYPARWVAETGNRPRGVSPIESATVERFSRDGYWVRTPDELFHVSESDIEAGDWQLIERKYQQN